MKTRRLIVLAVLAYFCCVPPLNADDKAYPHRIFPASSPPADRLDVVDIHTAPADVKLAVITLQGQINASGSSKVYVIYYDEQVYHGDWLWLKQLVEKKYIGGYTQLTIDEYFKKYNASYDSVIIYDPNLPASLNLATMMASLERGIVAAPSVEDAVVVGKKRIDLRGRWHSNVEAYEWAFKELWPKMNHRMLASYYPNNYPSAHCLRDYLVANKIFTFWVTGANVSDGKISNAGLEKAFAEKLFAAAPPNVPVLGFWSAPGDDGLTEYGGVGLAGEYGKGTVGCDGSANLTVLSGIRSDVRRFADEYSRRPRPAGNALDKTKVYISFVIQDSGDSPTYWQYIEHKVWLDPNRGKIPIGWSLGPPMAEMMPSVLEWFYDNATPNDYFYMGLSGTYYVHPYRNLFAKTDNPDGAWREYLDGMQFYCDLLKLRQIAIYTDAWLPFDRKKNDPVTQKLASIKNVDALIMGMGRDEAILGSGPDYLLGTNKVLVSHVVNRWDVSNMSPGIKNNIWLTQEIHRNTPKMRPAFLFVHPLSWSYYPSDLMDVAARLGDEYVVVSPDELTNLCRNYLKNNDQSK